jgi:hypothetical protein
VLALDLKTGKLRWHYQLVRHELWEADQSTPFILCDATGGRTRQAIAVMRTDGYLAPARSCDRNADLPGGGAARAAGCLPEDRRDSAVSSKRRSRGPDCTPAELLPPGFKSGCYFDVIQTAVPNSAQPHMTARFAPWPTARKRAIST